MLIFHIVVALTGIVYALFGLLRPAAKRLRNSYILTGLTLASGTYLVVVTHSPILSACLSGLTYTGLVTVLNVASRYRLLALQGRSSD